MRRTGVGVLASPFMQDLTDALAIRLSEPVDDPFAGELVVVPNVGVRDWLQRELCTRLGNGSAGIVANIRFVFVQSFLDMVFSASGSPSIDEWKIDRLMWRVHRAIDGIGRRSVPGADRKPLTVARVVADLFDRYGVHRPSMLRYWNRGRAVDGVEPLQDLPDHLLWQQVLFSRLCGASDGVSPADRLAELDDRIRTHGVSDALPRKITLFGFVTVNATMRGVIDAIGSARDVQVYVVHPAMSNSTDSSDSRDRLILRDQTLIDQSGNPLLSRWGRPAMETPMVLGGSWAYLAVPSQQHLRILDRLRQSVIADRRLEMSPIDETDEIFGRGDGSIQVHACHGRVRQVEVLRDALLHLLEDDPTLTLDDISIQCADLRSFAPIIPAIFGSGHSAHGSTAPPLDVCVADLVLAGDNAELDAFWALLDLARSRCGVGEMLTILTAPPIRRRFDIDEEVLARVSDWADSLAIKFGLDTEHRQKWGMPMSIDVGTWDAALDRLFMGFAIPAETPFEGPGGIVPYDDVSVTDAPHLARIAEFLTRVRHLVARLDSPHTVVEWAEIFSSVIVDFFDDSEATDFACRGVLEALDRLVDAAESTGSARSDLFGFDEITSILKDAVVASAVRPRFRTGAVTVTELLPQQGVPYRVIALLGVSEAMFASGGVLGDDVLGLRPCVGDPMPTAAGRLHMLNVLLAARDAVIITVDGADINNNKPIPLPVPIQELLEATVAVMNDSDSDDSFDDHMPGRSDVRILMHHPRQPFATRALEVGEFRSDRPFTFDRVAIDVHERLAAPAAPVLAARSGRSVDDVRWPRVTVENLRRVVSKPAEFFTHDALGVRLPSSDFASANDFIEFWPSHLGYSRVGRGLLDDIMRSSSEPHQAADTIVQHMALSGQFPPGRLGELASAHLKDEVLSIVNLLPEAARRFEDYRSVDVDEISAPDRAETAITGAIGNVLGHDLIRTSFTKFRRDMALAPWIELALATYLEPEHTWTARIVARGKKGEGVAHTITIAGNDSSTRMRNASQAIGTALGLIDAMSRGRIPYLPRTAETISRSSLEAGRSSFEEDIEYSVAARFLFGRVSWDDFIAEDAFDDDPPGRSSKRASRYAHFVWDSFAATTNSTLFSDAATGDEEGEGDE